MGWGQARAGSTQEAARGSMRGRRAGLPRTPVTRSPLPFPPLPARRHRGGQVQGDAQGLGGGLSGGAHRAARAVGCARTTAQHLRASSTTAAACLLGSWLKWKPWRHCDKSAAKRAALRRAALHRGLRSPPPSPLSLNPLLSAHPTPPPLTTQTQTTTASTWTRTTPWTPPTTGPATRSTTTAPTSASTCTPGGRVAWGGGCGDLVLGWGCGCGAAQGRCARARPQRAGRRPAPPPPLGHTRTLTHARTHTHTPRRYSPLLQRGV